MTADAVLALARERGVDFALEGRCPGGEVGAYFGRAPDGSRLVFKWSEAPDMYESLVWLVDRITAARDAGYPLPKYWPPIDLPGAVLIVQEAVVGGWSDTVSDALIDTLLELNGLQRALAPQPAGERWNDFLIRTLTVGAGSWCLHEPLRTHSSRTRRILARVERVVGDLRSRPAPTGDLVHIDFHHRNVLQGAAGGLTAVIDWEGAMSGDKVFDLVTLAFCLPVANTSEMAEARVWRVVEDTGEPAAVAAYVAQMAIRRIDWTLRFHPDEADMWIGIAERNLARFAPV